VYQRDRMVGIEAYMPMTPDMSITRDVLYRYFMHFWYAMYLSYAMHLYRARSSYKTGMHTASSTYRVCVCLDIYLSIIISGYLPIIQDHQSYRIMCVHGYLCIWTVHRGIYRSICPPTCMQDRVCGCVCVNTCLSIIQDLVCAWVSSHMHTGACLCGCLYAVTLVESVCKYIYCVNIYILCRCMHVYAYDSA